MLFVPRIRLQSVLVAWSIVASMTLPACLRFPDPHAKGAFPCSTAAHCLPHWRCTDGFCVRDGSAGGSPCREPSDCTAPGPCESAATPACVEGACVYIPLAAGGPCNDQDACTVDDACSAAGECSGLPVKCGPPPSPECINGDTTLRVHVGGGRCEPETGTCTFVYTDAPCPNCTATCLAECAAAACRIDPEGGCTVEVCTPGQSPLCQVTPVVDEARCTPPTSPGATLSGYCRAGVCLECLADEHCASNDCDGGFCTGLELGAPCTVAESCRSGFCADGVCCATACDGLCQECGVDGACNVVPADDPACPIVDCPNVSTECTEQVDIETERCRSLGACKTVADCERILLDGAPCGATLDCSNVVYGWVEVNLAGHSYSDCRATADLKGICDASDCIPAASRDCLFRGEPESTYLSRCSSACVLPNSCLQATIAATITLANTCRTGAETCSADNLCRCDPAGECRRAQWGGPTVGWTFDLLCSN